MTTDIDTVPYASKSSAWLQDGRTEAAQPDAFCIVFRILSTRVASSRGHCTASKRSKGGGVSRSRNWLEQESKLGDDQGLAGCPNSDQKSPVISVARYAPPLVFR